MRIVITLLTLLILTSCLKSSKNSSTESKHAKTQTVVVDSLLNKHRTIITMDKFELTNGVENEVQIKIQNIEAENIVIYTATSEATVKVGVQSGSFMILPELKTNYVAITVNYLGEEGLIKLGQIRINTSKNQKL